MVEQLWRDFAGLGELERHVIEEGQSVEETAEAVTRGIEQQLMLEQVPTGDRHVH